MPTIFSEILVALTAHTLLWAIIVIAAMAATAVTLFVFWDLLGRGITLVARAFNVSRTGRRN